MLTCASATPSCAHAETPSFSASLAIHCRIGERSQKSPSMAGSCEGCSGATPNGFFSTAESVDATDSASGTTVRCVFFAASFSPSRLPSSAPRTNCSTSGAVSAIPSCALASGMLTPSIAATNASLLHVRSPPSSPGPASV
ncbi:Uncharacterised protein [Mycobacteroides abscessus subsp. abscessus]|nr:Uncharacterised protein [Mycobacteroides abscessus subsp. abscessus]